MRDFRSRLITESSELNDKIVKLGSFINSTDFQNLDAEDQRLLTDQYMYMSKYSEILIKRIGRLQ